MFIEKHVEAKTRGRLRRELKKLKRIHPELLVFERNAMICYIINPNVYHVIVRYDDGRPIPENLDKDRFHTITFQNEEERRNFLNHKYGLNQYWLEEDRDQEEWKVIFEF